MSNNGTKITAPISLHGDVYPVLAIAPSGAYYDVAEVCRSGKINKWSFKKPINVAEVQELSDTRIQQAHCGLTFKELPTLRNNCNGYYTTQTPSTQDAVLNEVVEWTYTLPTGYYRLTDFDGYNHAALPSDRDWNNYTFTRSELQTVADSDAKIDDGATSLGVSIEKSFKIMTQFSIRLADGDGNWIGNGNLDMLPLAYAAGNGMISGEYWRIAYAVYIGSEWFLIVGRRVLSDMAVSTAQDYFPPDMSTNTRAVYRMLNSGQSSFTMIPCLVRNALISFETHPTKGSQGYLMSYVQVNADTVIYAMPSGAKSIKLNIASGEGTMPTINGVAVAASTGNAGENSWVIGTINRGYGGTQLDIPIQQAVILTKFSAPTTATSLTFNVRLTYKKYGNDAVQQFPPNSGSTDVKTYTITNTDRVAVTYGGVTTQYWGLVLTDTELSGLGFTIEDVQIFN